MGHGLTGTWALFYHTVEMDNIRRPLTADHLSAWKAIFDSFLQKSQAAHSPGAYSLRQGLHLSLHRSSRIFCHSCWATCVRASSSSASTRAMKPDVSS